MEFWGVEVKPGVPLKVTPEFGKLIHISQAALGEVNDAKPIKNLPLRLKIDNKNFIIGSLSTVDRTQIMFDLVFEREFELSHDWKSGSVYFIGYLADEPASDGEEFSDFDDVSEDEPVATENGKIVPKSKDVKPAKAILAAAAANGKAKDGKKKEEQLESDDEDDDESDSDEEMALDGLQGVDSSDASGDDSEDDDDDDLSEDEELPKIQESKKRGAESVQKTPAPKKAKTATPDKSGKKPHTATPIPSKASAGNKSKEQTPKSGSQVSCKSCSKTFGSESGLQAHTKAKHGK